MFKLSFKIVKKSTKTEKTKRKRRVERQVDDIVIKKLAMTLNRKKKKNGEFG